MADDRDEQKDSGEKPDNGKGAKGGPGGGGAPGGPGDGNMRFSRSMLGWILILTVAVAIFVLLHGQQNSPEPVSYTIFMKHLEQQHFEKVVVKDDGNNFILLGTAKKDLPMSSPSNPAQQYKTQVPATAMDGNGWKMLSDKCAAVGTDFKNEPSNNLFMTLLFNIAPYLLIILLVWFLFLRQIRSAGGGIGMLGNFGRSRHRLLSKEHTNVTFNDVAGIENAWDSSKTRQSRAALPWPLQSPRHR